MACSLADVMVCSFTLRELGLRADGQPLLGPLYLGKKLVLDLAPGADDWLEVLDVNSAPTDHHAGETTQALHVAVRLDGASAEAAPKLDAVDRKLQKEMGYQLKSGKTWYNMHRGNGKIILNVAVQNPVAPTVLGFFKGDRFEKGHGMEFLQAHLAGGSLKDYRCKAKAELECIQEDGNSITVLITAHSLMFVPMPKRAVVEYTEEEEAAMIQAAKRLRYRF